MNIIEKRKIWFILSSVLMLIGIIAIALGGLKLGLDFTGGSRIEVTGLTNKEQVESVLVENEFEVYAVQSTSSGSLNIKTNSLDENGHKKLIDTLEAISEEEVQELQFGTVGPTLSRDITTKAYLSIILGLLVVILYVAWSFRKSSKHLASWKYGVSAVVAVFHDAIFVIGAFALLGMFYGVEVDSLFVTAILTVISFSVHDTIVIFDRVRENLKKSDDDFGSVVAKSVMEMFGRSLNTSLVILFVISALLLLGGESIRYFILAMFLGMLVGTYSSLFVASPLLVSWKRFDEKMVLRKAKK